MNENELKSSALVWRHAPMIAGLTGVVLSIGVGLLSIAGVDIPVISHLLLLPAGMLTFLFIWGDSGTYLESMLTVLGIAAVINFLLGYLLGTTAESLVRRRTQFSLKVLFVSMAILFAAMALPVWSWVIIVPVGLLLAGYIVATARITRQ